MFESAVSALMALQMGRNGQPPKEKTFHEKLDDLIQEEVARLVKKELEIQKKDSPSSYSSNPSGTSFATGVLVGEAISSAFKG